MKRFVEVPATAIRTFMDESGFKPMITTTNEVTYQRPHESKHGFVVRVYSSIDKRDPNGVARACGTDAIRVVLVWDPKVLGPKSHYLDVLRLMRVWGGFTVGLETHKVLRTGTVDGVLKRMLGHMRACYATANKLRTCRNCHAPVFEDSGRCRVRACRERLA